MFLILHCLETHKIALVSHLTFNYLCLSKTLYFSLSIFLLFCSLHVALCKDVHRGCELTGWANSQSASGKGRPQALAWEKGFGKKYGCCSIGVHQWDSTFCHGTCRTGYHQLLVIKMHTSWFGALIIRSRNCLSNNYSDFTVITPTRTKII